MNGFLSNLPLEMLSEENDYIGILSKAKLMEEFLELSTDQDIILKMIVLYGPWGSGKSTLMKHLNHRLKPSFNTFFFEAWEFEGDLNLSNSLLQFVASKSESVEDQLLKELCDIGTKLFAGIAKSVTIKTPILNINGEKLTAELEKEPEKTYMDLSRNFKINFRRWEDQITKGDNPKFNIVFIDDLDRCEPNNVLALIAAIKLFFTYGNKTLFFFGVDKYAISQAVKTKYGDVIKSDEYLEKIFDFSFTMPTVSIFKSNHLKKLVSMYFPKRKVPQLKTRENISYNISDAISIFLIYLGETNPRRLKKILNKFKALSVFLEHGGTNYAVPNIYKSEIGNYGDTIMVIYMIILHEFYPQKFAQLFDMKAKELSYIKAINNNPDLNDGNKNASRSHISSMCLDIRSYKPFNRFKTNSECYTHFVFLFAPLDIQILNHDQFQKNKLSSLKVDQNSIEYKFISYLDYIDVNPKHFENSDCDLRILKQLIGDFL